MPTYEYKCRDCDRQFEVTQRMSDAPLGECPDCGGAVKRLIGAGAGIIFKGSGFYCTDYRSEGYKQRVQQDQKPEGTPKKAAETTSVAAAEK